MPPCIKILARIKEVLSIIDDKIYYNDVPKETNRNKKKEIV